MIVTTIAAAILLGIGYMLFAWGTRSLGFTDGIITILGIIIYVWTCAWIGIL